MELDRICTMQNGGVTSCAQCGANPVRACRCYNIFQHDYTSNDGGCINNCGQIIPCVGAVVQKEYIHEIKAATLNSLIRKNCGMSYDLYCNLFTVMSSLQKAMDELCGGGLIMRIHSGEYGCYRDDEVSYDIYSVCLDGCGINVPCMGYKNGLNPIRTINPMAVDWDRYNRNCGKLKFLHLH
uniref:Microneme 1-like protein n=1 Tax=Babesia bovis TaxID=5865 RepID=D3GBB6_BABBO|nr:microneme 1-like protein [Babesia bovis]